MHSPKTFKYQSSLALRKNQKETSISLHEWLQYLLTWVIATEFFIRQIPWWFQKLTNEILKKFMDDQNTDILEERRIVWFFHGTF